MKGIKKLSLIALGLLFVASVASCNLKNNNNDDNKQSDNGQGNNPVDPVDPVGPVDPVDPVIPEPEDPDPDGDGVPTYVEMEELDSDIGTLSTLEQPANYPGIYINEENKLQYKLLNIKVYTDTNTTRKDLARTTFYLGEEFNYNNLLVIAEFNKLDENGQQAKDEYGRVITIRAKVTNFQVNSSAIDTSVMGAYSAQVSYRFSDTVRTTSYTVLVKSSEFETTKNLEYIAGVKVGYKADVATDIFKLKNDGRIATTYVQLDGSNTFDLDVSKLNIQLVKNTVNGVATAFRTEFLDFDMTTLTNDTATRKIHNADNTFVLDYSAVNTGEVGSYKIPITYKADDIVIDGKPVENVVKAFIVVDVISPVEEIIQYNTYVVEASMDLPNFSEYPVMLVRKCLEGDSITTDVEMAYITNDLFTYENFVSYSRGKQNAKFVLKEKTEDGETLSFSAEVTVTESTTYNINVVNNLAGGTVLGEKTDGDKKYYTEYDLGNGVKAYNVQVTDSSGKDTLSSKARTCNSDGLKFDGFAGLDSLAKNSYIEFTFTEDTELILYVGSYGSDERSIRIYDAAGEVILEEAINPSECINKDSSDGKQSPMRFVIELSAGTYKVSAMSTQLSFHGYVIGTLK